MEKHKNVCISAPSRMKVLIDDLIKASRTKSNAAAGDEAKGKLRT